MLKLTIPGREWFDEVTLEFHDTEEKKLQLEHSLISVSKWESKWEKPFLDPRKKKTYEETLDYIRCMTLTQNVDPNLYYSLGNEEINKVNDYIAAPMTATWFASNKEGYGAGAPKIITSEVIYGWMVEHQIPFECQKWHLNRLLTLIRVCNNMRGDPKKMSKGEIMRQNAQINAMRRKASGSKG